MKKILLILLFSLSLHASENNNSSNKAERGSQFYEFDNTKTNKKQNDKSEKSDKNVVSLLNKILKVEKEQRDIQKKIYKLLSSEINPQPKKIVVNGKECVENSSAECFKMPLTKAAKQIPVLKEMLTNPTPQTAKNYLQWQAKYMANGPLKVGRSFEYAMNTFGNEAYPINLQRSSINTNSDELRNRRNKKRDKLLNEKYSDGSLAAYIFLSDKNLDIFSKQQIVDIVKTVENKKAIHLIFSSINEKNNFLDKITKQSDKEMFSEVPISINKKSFDINHIYMTPTYIVATKKGKKSKKQAIAVGRISQSAFSYKVYEWLEQTEVIKRGGLSDYKVWNEDE